MAFPFGPGVTLGEFIQQAGTLNGVTVETSESGVRYLKSSCGTMTVPVPDLQDDQILAWNTMRFLFKRLGIDHADLHMGF